MDLPQDKSPVRLISDECLTVKRSPLAPLQWKSINQNLLSHNEKPCNVLYFSPLETEAVRRKRAEQFGLTPPPKDSYLHNQSLPYALKYPENGNSNLDMGESRKCTIDKFKGDSLNSISFSPSSTKISKAQKHKSRHLSGSWLLYRYIESGPGNGSIHASVQNPNKAVVTINARTSEILTSNKVASILLGLEEHSKEKHRLCDYILSREDQYSLTEAVLKSSGELVYISGKVMDLVTNTKQVIPVSVWARQLHTEDDPRCLVVMEAVERITGVVKLDFSGKVVSCDNCFATLYGYPSAEEMKDLDIRELIPSINLDSENYCGDFVPKEGLKQCTTGRTKDGSHFPLTIMIQPSSESSQVTKKEKTYKGVVWVFNNISGMITLLPDGTIHSCNTNFSLFLFGYTQNELVGKSISVLIPTFYEDVEFLDTESVALPPFDDDDDSNARCCCASDGRTTADSIGTDPPRPVNPMGKHVELLVDDVIEGVQNFAFTPSPIENQIAMHYNQMSPFVKDKFDFSEEKIRVMNEKVPEVEGIKTEELSESSSHYGNSSKHLSYSESQDTLHSCTNSITESDLNANVLDTSECDECSKKVEEKRSKSISCEQKNDSVSPSYFSDSSDSEESFSSLAEDILPNKVDSSACDNVKISITDVHLNISSKSNKTENEKFHSPPCSQLSEGSSNSVAFLKASTPRIPSQSAAIPMTDDSLQSLPEGGFYGIGRHKDGSDLAIEYYIKKIMLEDGKHLYCLWVARDPVEVESVSDIPPPSLSNSTSHSGTNKTDKSQTEDEDDDQSSCSSVMSDSYYTSGSFSDNYTILQHIGKGAYGCVKKAFRNEDGLLVIAKFIRKSEVYKELWVYDNQQNKKVPLEISLLTTIDHPNIVKSNGIVQWSGMVQLPLSEFIKGIISIWEGERIIKKIIITIDVSLTSISHTLGETNVKYKNIFFKVLDVYENENCFQMVMEKHGSGMDLFEFIEREPIMDEPLASYIFRQIVSALSYLHSLFILHRDIKDENIILDEHFHVKLIDFGSATFMGEELFSTFCGTMEYCSPEVIQGNKYRGPELEMWALGVTLYTLIFGENPFIDVDETLKGEIRISRVISDDLSELIHHLLEQDPLKRCTLSEVEQHPWVIQPVNMDDYKFSDVISVSPEEMNPPKYITSFEDVALSSSNCTDSGVSYETKKSVSVQPRSSTESEAESLS